jgi:hypothetical protein
MIGRYWAWVGGNIGAMPLEVLITVIAGAMFRKPLSRLAAWARREEIAEARATRAIVADLYRHHTDRDHPAAPGTGSEAK